MLKNKKVAALLIAIQSMAFLPAVQANAADLNAVKSQNGEINDAVAFKNGTSCISGNIDGLGNGSFVLNNGKFNKLNNIASDADLDFYGAKYADVHKGQYFVDLSNGTVVSSNIQKSDNDSVSEKLRNNLKNENQGRFRKEELINAKTLKELPRNKFSDGWYESRYSLAETSTIINGGTSESTVYSDINGNYIDADYSLGEISIGLDSGKTAKITNTHDKVENVVSSISNIEVIGEDSKNIYRLAEITVKLDAVDGGIVSINGIKLDGNATGFLSGDSGRTVTFDVIQSLSKEANGEKVLGIRYPKKVVNYLIGNNKGSRVDILKNSADGFSICNGKLINYRTNGAFIEAESIDLKNGSSNFNYIEVNNKSSVKVNNKDTGYDFDVNGSLFALSDNNIYKFNIGKGFESLYSLDDKYSDISVYDEGNIVAWNKQSKKYVLVGGHSVIDSNLDLNVNKNVDSDKSNSDTEKTDTNAEKINVDNKKIDASNSNESENKDITSTSNSTASVSESDVSNESINDSVNDSSENGWKAKDGKWNYYKEGNISTGWTEIEGKWYYFESDGTMNIGWKNINDSWYYFDENGVMSIGWKAIDGDWYYFNKKGEMLSNTVVNGYLVSFNGKMLN